MRQGRHSMKGSSPLQLPLWASGTRSSGETLSVLMHQHPSPLAKRHSQKVVIWTFAADRAGSGHPRKPSSKGSGDLKPNTTALNEKAQ